MPKVLPANAVEVAHSKEAFSMIFRFQASDGHVEAVYIVISPAKTTADLLGREIQDYEKEVGTITPWTVQNRNGTNITGSNHLST